VKTANELNVLSVLRAYVHFASSFPGQLTDHVAVCTSGYCDKSVVPFPVLRVCSSGAV
jgi:hypothetical protein